MVAVTRVGSARSRWACDGRPSLGPDEDAFTLAAAATEAALEGADPRPDPLSIDLVGPLPALADWAFPLLIGVSTPPFRSTSVGAAISRHHALAHGAGALVVEVQGTEKEGPVEGPSALAFVLEDAAGWDLAPSTRRLPDASPATLDQLEALRDAGGSPVGVIGAASGPRYEVKRTQQIPWLACNASGDAAATLPIDRRALALLSNMPLEPGIGGGVHPSPPLLGKHSFPVAVPGRTMRGLRGAKLPCPWRLP